MKVKDLVDLLHLLATPEDEVLIHNQDGDENLLSVVGVFTATQQGKAIVIEVKETDA